MHVIAVDGSVRGYTEVFSYQYSRLGGSSLAAKAAVEAALESKPAKVDEACYAIGGGGGGFSTTTALEASPSKSETAPISSNNGAVKSFIGVRQDVTKALTADAVASFCRANTLCRNFLKRAEGSGSVDLVVVSLIRYLPHFNYGLLQYDKGVNSCAGNPELGKDGSFYACFRSSCQKGVMRISAAVRTA